MLRCFSVILQEQVQQCVGLWLKLDSSFLVNLTPSTTTFHRMKVKVMQQKYLPKSREIHRLKKGAAKPVICFVPKNKSQMDHHFSSWRFNLGA